MTKKSKSTTTGTSKEQKSDVTKTKGRVIPQVPKSERIILNEGHEPKIRGYKKESQ